MPPSVKTSVKLDDCSSFASHFVVDKKQSIEVSETKIKPPVNAGEKSEKTSDRELVSSSPSSSSSVQKESPYIYVKNGEWSVVWRNVTIFAILHLLYLYGMYLLFAERRFLPWIISWLWGYWGGMGVTAGAHRLWSHKSYKARLPLRIFLMIGHCIAGQNDLYTWCRDHRVHHKFSETDADPHNSMRGYFFAHIGWLLMKKHPDVMKKGKDVALDDLWDDPVIRFQKRFYLPLYFTFSFILPAALPVYLWNESWLYAFFVAGVMRYTTSLHSTWFVNSTAHMFGSRPYNVKINSRENSWVSFGAFGEGYHNYHHTFPRDYATSEDGCRLNVSKLFIELMAAVGQAYDLKRVSKEYVESRKEKIAAHQH